MAILVVPQTDSEIRESRSSSADGRKGSESNAAGMIESGQSVHFRIKGRWVAVPVLGVNGDKLITRGKYLKIAWVRGEEMKQRELQNPERYLAALKSSENRTLKADIFTFTQKLPATQPRYAYPIEWESLAAIPLTSYRQWWESLPQETRKNVRRSQKRGVEVRITDFDADLIEGLQGVNNDSPMRQGLRNAYYGLSAEETRDRYSEFLGRCDFICAYSGKEMIGFLHLVYREDIAAILNLTTKPSHFDKRPANALMAKAVEICGDRGVSYITYGLYNYGNKRDSSLKEFKVRHRFEEVLVPRYFVPLTLWGKLCMKAKLHLGLIGILPSTIISAGLRARALWYGLKNSKRRCSSTSERSNCNRQMEG